LSSSGITCRVVRIWITVSGERTTSIFRVETLNPTSITLFTDACFLTSSWTREI
jgi:hypothetical protein